MGLQAIWSFCLAFLDACALVKKKVLHNPGVVSLFVVGDWVSFNNKNLIRVLFMSFILTCWTLNHLQVTATLSLAAASSSAGITILYFNDLGSCGFGQECQKYQLAVVLAFMSWITISISSLIMFWTLAAV